MSRGFRVCPGHHRRRSEDRRAPCPGGVIGQFALDFVVVQDTGGDWLPYAIEVNLRKGGTTHPFLTLQFYLTAGTTHRRAFS